MPAVRNVIIKSFWNVSGTLTLFAKHLSRLPTLEPITKQETGFEEAL